MKTLIVAAALLSTCIAWADPGHEHHPQAASVDTPGSKAFDNLRVLLGEWEGKGGPKNEPIHLWYKMISGGSALVETEKIGEEPEMITVYHLDNDKLMLEHYCSANNQPRMHAEPSDNGKQITFKLDGVTNLSNSKGGHMAGLVLDIQDKQHISQRWSWLDDSGKEVAFTFKLSRKK